jgi:hypothetical protein
VSDTVLREWSPAGRGLSQGSAPSEFMEGCRRKIETLKCFRILILMEVIKILNTVGGISKYTVLKG